MAIELPRDYTTLDELAEREHLSLADLTHQIERGRLIVAILLGRCEIPKTHVVASNSTRTQPFYLHPEDAIGVIQQGRYSLGRIFENLDDLGHDSHDALSDLGRGSHNALGIVATRDSLVITEAAWERFQRAWLCPENPPALPATSYTPQFKESDLLVTIYWLLLLAVDLQKEAECNPKHKSLRYKRGSGISKNAVWKDIEILLEKLEISTTGLGETKTRKILSVACQLGKTRQEEKI